jgi:hypothetical protein
VLNQGIFSLAELPMRMLLLSAHQNSHRWSESLWKTSPNIG